MSRSRSHPVAVSLALVVLLGLASTASASVPSESPADTFEVDGPRVRSIAVVGENVWIAGQFSQVQNGAGANVQGVTNLAALDRVTGELSTTATPLPLGGVSAAQVWKLATAGTTVYAAGKFKLSSGGTTYTNLLAFDGTDGSLIETFKPKGVPVAQSVAAGSGIVYAGGKKLVAFDAVTGSPAPGFVPSTITTDAALRPGHNTPPQFRDLQLIAGSLYAACQCDSLTQAGLARPVKALVRFDPVTGTHDESFSPDGAGPSSTGISVATDGLDLYLGGGGSDFVARYTSAGAQVWKRDTSGSTQAVAVSGTDVIIGGHFVEIADAVGDACGFKSSNPATLDPNDECATRNRLAAYSTAGELQPWDPSVVGKYNGVWAIALDLTSMHIGGEFKKIHGVAQTHYARLD
jgi:hypothetical protein